MKVNKTQNVKIRNKIAKANSKSKKKKTEIAPVHIAELNTQHRCLFYKKKNVLKSHCKQKIMQQKKI